MSVTIDKELNIVFPIREEKAWVHAMPISYDVYRSYFLPISRTYEVIHGNNLHMTGPRIAALTLEKVSIDSGVWSGPDGVQNGLMNEIKRLANVLMPVATGGWEMVPLQSAILNGTLTKREVSEIEGRIVFFTVVSATQLMEKQESHLALMWPYDVRTTLLNVTEYQASLQTSTTSENTGAKETASSIPS